MQYVSLYKKFVMNQEEAKKEYELRYNQPFAKKLNIYIKEHPSFYIVNEEMLNLIESIHVLNNKVIQLTKANRNLPFIFYESILRQTFIEEIYMTNEIEGVVSTKKAIKELMNSNKPEKYKRLFGLVNKYNEILNENEFQPIHSSVDLRNLYNKTMIKDVEKENLSNLPDGQLFRKEMVEVLSKGNAIHNGVYPENKIIEEMDKALKFLNDDSISILIRVAVFHYLFGYVHPFYDGNGRMARFISSYYLNTQLDTLCALQISIACKEYSKEYYNSFKITNDIRNKADLTYFILSFLEILEKGLKDLILRIQDKISLYTYYIEIIKNRKEKNKYENNILSVLLQNYLFDIEGLSHATLLEIAEISKKTLENRLKNLIIEGLVDVEKSSRTYLYKLNIENLNKLAN